MSTDGSTWDDASEYVPDPEADTTAVIDGFYEHLARSLDLSGDDIARMRARQERSQTSNAHLVVDEPARHNLRMTLALVAAYEELRPDLDDETALALVRRAFVEPLAGVVKQATAALLDSAPDPFRAMVELARTRESEAFGAGFEFEHPVDDDERFFADVRRCHYYDVLVANGVPQLAPVMCAFDGNWIEAIDPDRHGFRFERVTTIGLGGTHCPFHFLRQR